MNVVGFIFARGGSKGIPRKNIRLIAGKPLIAYSIEAGLASETIDRVVVSTDDEDIACVAREHGAEVPFMRPAELAADDSPQHAAWQHAIRALATEEGALPLDVFVSIPPTSPLRLPCDIDACVKTLAESDADVVVTMRPAQRSPYYNMLVLDDDGYAQRVIPPARTLHGRQTAPVVYDMTTVAYAARPAYILGSESLFEGRMRTVMVPPERALDIDTPYDLEIAEFLLARRAGKERGVSPQINT